MDSRGSTAARAVPAPGSGEQGLVRGIGLVDATALVVGSMIGSGIFIVSAESARVLGSAGWLLAAWAIAGILTMIAALSCSELAAMLPKAGGQYVFFREAYGPLVGFLFGWALFLVVQTGTIAAVAVAFAKFLGVLWPAVSSTEPLFAAGPGPRHGGPARGARGDRPPDRDERDGPARGNGNAERLHGGEARRAPRADGARPASRRRAAFRAAGAGILVRRFPGRRLPGRTGARRGGGHRDGGPLFSQSAWNNVTFAGEEIRRPERTLPLSLLAGCLIVTVLYVLANVSYANVLSLPEIAHAPADRVGTAAATRLFGPAAAAVTAAAIMVSTFGCVNGLILSGARVSFAMARDGLFFRRLASVNAASVPANALLAQGVWAGVLVLSGSYSDLLKYVISADILFYVMLVLAVIVLRRRSPEWPRPFRAPGYPVLPLLYAAAGIVLIAVLLAGNPRTTWPGYVLVATGIPSTYLWRRRS